MGRGIVGCRRDDSRVNARPPNNANLDSAKPERSLVVNLDDVVAVAVERKDQELESGTGAADVPCQSALNSSKERALMRCGIAIRQDVKRRMTADKAR